MAVDIPPSGRLPLPRDPLGSYRVCLVCLGNICRSPMAEVVLTDELARAGLAGPVMGRPVVGRPVVDRPVVDRPVVDRPVVDRPVRVDSAGTGDWHVGGPMDAGARAELARRRYDGSGHRARLFDPAWFPQRDLVLAMDRRNLAQLRRMAPDAESGGARLALFRTFDPGLAADDPYDGEVPDPYGGAPGDYALAFDLVQAAARGLATALAALLEVPAPRPGG